MVLTTVDPYFMTHDSKNWNAALPISVIFEAIKNIKKTAILPIPNLEKALFERRRNKERT